MKTTHLTEQKTVTRISVRPTSTHLAPHPETPRVLLEGVTLCPTCNGAGYRQTDLHSVEECPFCL